MEPIFEQINLKKRLATRSFEDERNVQGFAITAYTSGSSLSSWQMLGLPSSGEHVVPQSGYTLTRDGNTIRVEVIKTEKVELYGNYYRVCHIHHL